MQESFGLRGFFKSNMDLKLVLTESTEHPTKSLITGFHRH